MNYFTELLESYDQLKKRKYKLRLAEGNLPQQQPTQQPFQQMPTGGQIIMSSPYADPEIQNTFIEIEQLIPDIFNNLSLDDRKIASTVDLLKSAILGPTPNSMEFQLANCTQLLIESDVVSEAKIPVDKSLVKGVVENFKILLKLLTKMNINETEKTILRTIVGNVGPYIIIFKLGDIGSGLVFTNPVLVNLITSLERKFGFSGKCINPYSDSDFISKDESLKVLPCIANELVKRSNPSSTSQLISLIQTRISSLATLHGQWINEFLQGLRCVPLEQWKYVQTLSTFFGPEAASNIQKLINTLKITSSKRSPDLIIPLRSGGTYEVYNDINIASKKVRMVGFKDSNKIKPSLKISLDKESDLLTGNGSTSILLPRVFTHQVNYRVINELEDVVVKETKFEDLSSFLSGKQNIQSNILLDNILKSLIFKNLNIAQDKINSLYTYSNDILNLYNKIISLPSDASIKAETGKFLKENPIKKIIAILADKIKQESLYEELLNDSAKASILSLATINDFSDQDKQDYAKDIVFRYLKFQKLKNDLNSNNSDAVNYVLATILYLGLNLNLGASLEIKVINTQESFIFSQNTAILAPIIGVFQSNNWKFSFRDFNISLVSILNPECYIELRDSKNAIELAISSHFITTNAVRFNKVQTYESLIRNQQQLLELLAEEANG